MKKQLLFVFAVLGAQQSQAVSGAILAVMTGDKVIMVDNINQMPQNPASIPMTDIYSVKTEGSEGKVKVSDKSRDDASGVKVSCSYRGKSGASRCKIWFKAAGHYTLEQKVNGTKMFQHIKVVEADKGTSTKRKEKAKRDNQ